MASTADYVQIAVEETARYEGAVSTVPYRISTDVGYLPIQTVRVEPNPTFLDRSDELRSIDGGPPQMVDMFEPQGSIAMRAYPDLLPYLLIANGWSAAITQGDGSAVKDPDTVSIPATAYRWVFTKRTGIPAKSLQLILSYFNEAVWLKGQGFGLSSLSMNAAGDVTGDLQGLVVAKVADPSLTPSYIATTLPPFRRGDITLSWLSGTGTTGDFSFQVANELVRRHSFGLAAPSYFPDMLEHGDARVRVTGSIPKDVLDADDYDALVGGTTFSATAKWKSPKSIAATAYKYQMWLQMPACQYIGGQPDELRNTRRRGATFNWWAAVDPTAGYDAKITIVNALASIETYV